jgi:PAS domain S-box-containing protein
MLTENETTPTPSQENGVRPGKIHATGEMADRVRRFPWETTPVGAISSWPDALVCAVNLMLESQFPMLLAWGPEMVLLYNDACLPLLAEKHPRALGQTAKDCWGEAWHILAPKLTPVLERGAKFHFENELIPILRHGTLTDVYWTYSYSPVRDAAGTVCGILVVSHDVTAKLTAERERDAMATSLRNVLESTTDGLAVLDKQWRYTYVNDQGARMVSMRPEDLIGRSVWELFPHASETTFVREAGQAEETGQPRHFEAFYPAPLNVWLECHCYPSEHGLSVYFRDITEQKETEKALRVSESRFRKLFESDMMGVGIPDRFGAFRESNDELLRMTGYTREDQEAGLVRWDTMTPPEYADLDRAHIQEAAERGSCTPYEKEYIRKDGSRVPILCGYALLEGSEDEYIGFVLDLTAQKQSEMALRNSERIYRTVGESTRYGIWICDASGHNTYASDSFLSLVGMTQAECSEFGWGNALHPDEAETTIQLWKTCVETGGTWDKEHRFLGRDGAWHTILARGAPILDDGGNVAGWAGINLDIDRLKKAEAALREREGRFRALAESLPQLVWMANAEGETTYCNSRVFEYFGVAANETDIPSWAGRFHPEDVEGTFAAWRRSIELSEPYQVEYRLRRHDGVYRHFLARAIPVRNEAGKVERWIGSCTDLHDRKLAEDALRRSEKLATAGRLAASIAHEINNPLEGIINSIYLALQDNSLSEDTRSYLTMADQELARVSQITTQSLRFHKQSSSAREVDLCEVMRSVLTLFGRRLKAKQILVSEEWDQQALLKCFADEMRQVFANLVSNALDATQAGGALRIRIRKTRSWRSGSEEGVKVIVADTGSGIPRSVQEHLFEPFVSTKEATGIGLGLWVSEGIIRKHGGSIMVRSKSGEARHGTVIALFLPS